MAEKAYRESEVNDKLICKEVAVNNSMISYLLQENQNIRIRCLNNKKVMNLHEESKIKIPYNLIKSKNEIFSLTNLKNMKVPLWLDDNISYLIQYNEFLDYLLDNFYIYGSVASVMYHYGIINSVSIIEGLVIGLVKRYRQNCNTCKRQGKGCNLIINEESSERYMKALEILVNSGLTIITNDDLSKIQDYKKIRDDVHIYLKDANICNDDSLSKEKYQEIRLFLKEFFSKISSSKFVKSDCPDKIIKKV